jgi:hypothetical protein
VFLAVLLWFSVWLVLLCLARSMATVQAGAGSAQASSPPPPVTESLGECSKCALPVKPGTEGKAGQRSKDVNHRSCLSAYKRRMKQNKKHKPMQLAWEQMTPVEVHEWFWENSQVEEEDSSKRKLSFETEELQVVMNNKKVYRFEV